VQLRCCDPGVVGYSSVTHASCHGLRKHKHHHRCTVRHRYQAHTVPSAWGHCTLTICLLVLCDCPGACRQPSQPVRPTSVSAATQGALCVYQPATAGCMAFGPPGVASHLNMPALWHPPLTQSDGEHTQSPMTADSSAGKSMHSACVKTLPPPPTATSGHTHQLGSLGLKLCSVKASGSCGSCQS